MGNKNARSGNPAVRATRPITPPMPAAMPEATEPRSTARTWKKKGEHDDARDLLLPSGNVALVRRIAPEAFLMSGQIPDMLAPIIEKSIHSKQGLPPEVEKEMMADPKMLKSVIELMNVALVAAVVEPRVILAVPDGEERDPDVMLADEVDFEDKAFIFNYALGGSKDLQRFRSETGDAVARLSTEPDVSLPAQ